MLIYIFLLIFIPTILSYLILKFIYRIIFKSQKKVSKFLIFLGSIGLIIFYYTPYSYYLEPSFHKFRNICKLDPEIYQANGGKLDEEYYNKILGYYDMNWDTMIKTKKPFQLVEFIDKSRNTLSDDDIKNIHKITKPIPNKFSYVFDTKTIKDRIKFKFDIYVDIENDNVKPERPAWFDAEWQTYRIKGIEWNISTSGDFRMPTKILDCDYFKKGLNNAK